MGLKLVQINAKLDDFASYAYSYDAIASSDEKCLQIRTW